RRAQLRHLAPQAMNSLRDQTGASQTRRRQRVTLRQRRETLPRDPALVRAATKPLVPDPNHVVAKGAQARDISGDPVVRVVPAQLRRQCFPLLPDRVMAVLAAPLTDRS